MDADDLWVTRGFTVPSNGSGQSIVCTCQLIPSPHKAMPWKWPRDPHFHSVCFVGGKNLCFSLGNLNTLQWLSSVPALCCRGRHFCYFQRLLVIPTALWNQGKPQVFLEDVQKLERAIEPCLQQRTCTVFTKTIACLFLKWELAYRSAKVNLQFPPIFISFSQLHGSIADLSLIHFKPRVQRV